MISCIIIDDQPPAQRVLKKYIEDLGTLALEGCFSDALTALEFLKGNSVDLIFLDIHLPKISGLQFLKILPVQPQVILTTAYSEYALEGYELNVTDYLLKPFSFERFVKAVSKVKKGKEENNEKVYEVEKPLDVLFIKSGHDHLRVKLESVLFIKSELDYTEIFTAEKKYLTSSPLRYWAEKLPAQQFAQVHKSYVVNVSNIIKVSRNQIFFDSGQVVPIGRAFRENFVRAYLQT
ncbi:MAG: LytTR family DNA-binding domain-containing protein [Cytophagales bacterium]|nr:LytTR family DNA-binding domain-containing protein [Cytophagales bacterium]